MSKHAEERRAIAEQVKADAERLTRERWLASHPEDAGAEEAPVEVESAEPSIRELREEAKSLGLSAGGSKVVLMARIAEARAGSDEE